MKNDHVHEPLMSIKEVASWLQVHPMTAYRLARSGKIRGFRVGGRWRFKKEDLNANFFKKEKP